VLDADTAEQWANRGEKVILVRVETSPEDIHGMHAAQGILTARGGMTSHAAVVARGMGRPCVSGASSVAIDRKARTLRIGQHELKEGEEITLDGANGQVMLGIVPTIDPELVGDFATLMEWADGLRRMRVRTNAETPEDWAALVPVFEALLSAAGDQDRARAKNNLGVVLHQAGRTEAGDPYIYQALDESGELNATLNLLSVDTEREAGWESVVARVAASASSPAQRFRAAELLRAAGETSRAADLAPPADSAPHRFAFGRGVSFGLGITGRGEVTSSLVIPMSIWLLADLVSEPPAP